MWVYALIPFCLQAIAIGVDEIYFHLQRGLPKWERIGHPIDTLSMLLCLGIVLWVPFSEDNIKYYLACAVFSCVMVTKDEFVHKHHCPASENWLHALLFLLHPITLATAGLIWPVINGVEVPWWMSKWLDNQSMLHIFMILQFWAVFLFFAYQTIYWNFIWKDTQERKSEINNAFYDDLNDKWYTALNHPVALLRAENEVRAPWVLKTIQAQIGKRAKVLDVGCGAGFLSNALASSDFEVTGVDISKSSLEVAQRHDVSGKAIYLEANAYNLPFENESFDVVCAMDILEHVEKPARLIKEASRVLRPGGLFFFHTFNRNLFSYLLVIKGVDWFVKNAPENMHVYELFITPDELNAMCTKYDLKVEDLRGFSPDMFSKGFWKLPLTRTIAPDFKFHFSKSTATGYCGFARKTKAKA